MSKNQRIELIRSSLDGMRELRRIGPAAAQWGTEADLEYLLACYDSIKAQYDGLLAICQKEPRNWEAMYYVRVEENEALIREIAELKAHPLIIVPADTSKGVE